MQRRVANEHATAIARHIRVDSILIDIAIKNLAPLSADWKADAVIEPVEGRQMHDHYDVATISFNPSLKGEYAISVMGVDHTKSLAAQSWITPAQIH